MRGASADAREMSEPRRLQVVEVGEECSWLEGNPWGRLVTVAPGARSFTGPMEPETPGRWTVQTGQDKK
ncbi:hypothetical protein GCM10010411_55910 [Actinomadura fulvescens]|uniref:Uncharacterized protein n=1 Tax=Actinomadura fulvescens TaxID=46160 RepID=A0ABP6CCA6_9ACTN